MRKIPPLLLYCSIIALSTLTARGQPSNGSVNVTFQALATAGSLPALYYKPTPSSQDNQRPMGLAQGVVLPDVYPYAGPATMEFYTGEKRTGAEASGPGGATALSYKAVGRAVFPKSGAYLLYISPGPNGTVAAAPVSQSPVDYPGGSFAFINATGVPLEVKTTDDNNTVTATVALRVGGVSILPIGEPVMIRFSRTDKTPVEEIQHIVVEPNKLLRTSVLLLPDFSVNILNDEVGTIPAPGARSAGGPSPAQPPASTAAPVPAVGSSTTAKPAVAPAMASGTATVPRPPANATLH